MSFESRAFCSNSVVLSSSWRAREGSSCNRHSDGDSNQHSGCARRNVERTKQKSGQGTHGSGKDDYDGKISIGQHLFSASLRFMGSVDRVALRAISCSAAITLPQGDADRDSGGEPDAHIPCHDSGNCAEGCSYRDTESGVPRFAVHRSFLSPASLGGADESSAPTRAPRLPLARISATEAWEPCRRSAGPCQAGR